MKRLISLVTGLLLMSVNMGSVTASATPIKTAQGITPIAWDTTASGFSGETGQTYRFRCPGGGTAATIYGSDIYTDDSSICTAAAHAGVISMASGGNVKIEIRPGRSAYGSTTRHGIKSNSYGDWRRSFVFISFGSGKQKMENESMGDVTSISWDTTASGFSGEAGQRYSFRCPSGGTANTIYGSDVYTDDSSICTAAVHASLISMENGGEVTIEFRPGRSAYGSTSRRGIKSNSYGTWRRSFSFR